MNRTLGLSAANATEQQSRSKLAQKRSVMVIVVRIFRSSSGGLGALLILARDAVSLILRFEYQALAGVYSAYNRTLHEKAQLQHASGYQNDPDSKTDLSCSRAPAVSSLCAMLLYCSKLLSVSMNESGDMKRRFFRVAIFVLTICCIGPDSFAEDPNPPLDYDLKTDVVYHKVGDRELLVDIFTPKPDKIYPAVLVVHGGAWRSGNRKQLYGYSVQLAKRGFTCFAIDYRLAPKHKFPSQIDDCRAAVRFIRKNAKAYKVDPKRVGAIGYSAGGHLVSLLGTTGQAPSSETGNIDTRLQAVVAGGAPTDFRSFPDNGEWARFLMGGNLDTAKEKFAAASSVNFVDKTDPPMFFFNGTQDRLVPVIWSKATHEALKKVGVRSEMVLIEGAGHIMAAANPGVLKQAFDFLESELKKTSGQ